MPHGSLVFESTREVCHLGREIGRGGQKSVYECQVKDHVVAIVDNPESDYDDRTFKLTAWPVPLLAQEMHAFPVDRIRNQQGQIVGIVMPKRGGRKLTETLSDLTRPDWLDDRLLLEIFLNLALAVNAANSSGYLIGDFNPENVLFTGQGKVAILDCDSFYHTAGGLVFSTPVGVTEYLPPELQKFHRDGRLADAQRTLGGDSFAFGTMLFTAVMQGNHPFANQDAISVGELIESSTWPHRGTAGPQPRRSCPRLEDIPSELADMFRRTFDAGLLDPKARPSMNDWHDCLKRLSQSAARASYSPQTPPPTNKQKAHDPGTTKGSPPPVKPKTAQGHPRNTSAPATGSVTQKFKPLDMPRMLAFLVFITIVPMLTWAGFDNWHSLMLQAVGAKDAKDAPKIWTDLKSVGLDK